MARLRILPFLVVFALTLFAPALALSNTEDRRTLILVSVPPQASFVERLTLGLPVDVSVMIPPTMNHGTYEPSLEQMRSVSKATLYIKVGHPAFTFEEVWIDRFLDENPNLRIVDSSIGIKKDSGDPHLWVAPSSVKIMCKNIAAQLKDIMRDRSAQIDQNLAGFEKEIEAVDSRIKNALAASKNKSFIVFHPDWGYFARDYGLEQISLEKDGKEVTPGRIAEVIRLAKQKQIKVILQQPQHPRESADLIAQEIGGTVELVDPFARDWLANMSKAAEAFRRALGA